MKMYSNFSEIVPNNIQYIFLQIRYILKRDEHVSVTLTMKGLTCKMMRSASDPSSRPSTGRFYSQSRSNLCHGCPKFYEHSKIHTSGTHIFQMEGGET